MERVHYRIHKRLSPVFLLDQFSTVYASPSNYLSIPFNIILPSTSRIIQTNGFKMCVTPPQVWMRLRLIQTCTPNGHLYRVTYIRCRIDTINPLKPELNPICYLLALLGAHHFLHVSRIRVTLLTFRLLMSYIYIWSTHS